MELDHVIPFSKDGPDQISNLVGCCRACNREKHAHDFEELRTEYGGFAPGELVQSAIMKKDRINSELLFHEPYNDRRDWLKRYPSLPNDPEQFYEHLMTRINRTVPDDEDSAAWRVNKQALLLASCWELQFQRPYYNIYPIVYQSLERTNLKVAADYIFDQELLSLAVCFPKGKELIAGDYTVKSFLFCKISEPHRIAGLTINFEISGKADDYTTTFMFPSEKLLSDAIPTGDESRVVGESTQVSGRYAQHVQKCLAIAIGVYLLSKDPENLIPVILRRDQKKTLSPRKLEEAIERAKRAHHKTGFTVGADWTVGPHVRRPHFALRWTGKGGDIPKLVPVKGTIVRGETLYDVPTGYWEYDSSP